MIEIRPATPAHFAALYPDGFRYSAQAVTALQDGRIMGLAGLYRTHGNTVLFATLSAELRRHPFVIVRQAKKLLARTTGPVYAFCDVAIPAAPAFLAYLDFEPVMGTLWRKRPFPY